MPDLPEKSTRTRHEGDQGRRDPDEAMQPGPQVHNHRVGHTDFRTWDRATLESFARDCSAECRALQDDLRVAIDAYRRLMR